METLQLESCMPGGPRRLFSRSWFSQGLGHQVNSTKIRLSTIGHASPQGSFKTLSERVSGRPDQWINTLVKRIHSYATERQFLSIPTYPRDVPRSPIPMQVPLPLKPKPCFTPQSTQNPRSGLEILAGTPTGSSSRSPGSNESEGEQEPAPCAGAHRVLRGLT